MATMGQRVDGILARLEWRWSLSNLVIGAYFVASAALPAWAVGAMSMFEHYAPLSWVVAGFAGLVLAVVAFAVFSLAYRGWVRSRYDRSLYEKSGFVDPMAKTFEDKRIFLSEFCLPSDQFIEGKTFINCEIIGPAIMFFRNGNQAYEQRLPYCDAVAMRSDKYFNAITLDNCTFRACSFKRITVAIGEGEFVAARQLNWLNWISEYPAEPQLPGMQEAPTPQPESSAPPLLEGTATKTRP